MVEIGVQTFLIKRHGEGRKCIGKIYVTLVVSS